MIEQFHFLRPWWLLLLLPLGATLWLLIRRRYESGSWRAVIDERLLPHVLTGTGETRRSLLRWILAGVALLVIIALAGPTWEKLPRPVYHKETALVIALDLSRSMDAADIKPSRLARARHKIADILNLRIEGQTALIVYAADAFTVTPLTTDVDTILALLPDLDTSLMPAQGTRADRALRLAFELFANSGVARGDVLLISDGFSDLEVNQLQALHAKNPGHRLSVLASGTREGGPVPLVNGGFLKDRDGAIVIAAMQEEHLRSVASSGGGVYATISVDDIDINTLAYLMESSIDDREARLADRSTDLWRELGPWLVLLALPLAALTFRRGLIWLLPLYILVVPPDAQAFDWQSLWRNDDQRASRLFDEGEHAAAARLFDNPGWKASANYRAGDYAAALDGWRQLDDEDALYNRGNALARLGRFDDAIDAYDTLLERNPAHEDARYNRERIEDFLKQQQQQQQQQGQGQGQGNRQQQQQQGQGDRGEQQSQQPDNGGQGETDAQGQEQQGQPEPQQAERQADEDAAQPQSAGQDDATDPQPIGSDELARIDRQMSEQAAEQWLRKIPDDPGGLLRRKFLYQYRERGGVDAEEQSW